MEEKEYQALLIDKRDNVAMALENIDSGGVVNVSGSWVTVSEPIKAGHKFALEDIPAGSDAVKYGHSIGRAVKAIHKGQWVHSRNLASGLSGAMDYQYIPQVDRQVESEKSQNFEGYLRHDGRVGIRNEIWIVVTVGCINSFAEMLVRKAEEKFRDAEVDGIFTFTHPYGCSQLGDDLLNTQKILKGMVAHPNAGAVLVLGLGCENNNIEAFKNVLGEYDPNRVGFLNLQDEDDELEAALRMLEELVGRAEKFKRQTVPASSLVLGLKCGGSDAFSGITANPLLGEVADRLILMGGSAVLTEVPEMFGAETVLMNRSINRDVFQRTINMVNSFKDYFIRHNQPVYENPSPGNKEGGLTTLEEKSLGCIRKAGSRPVVDVIDYGDAVTKQGLTLLSGPGNDLVSTTALTAAGAQLVVFTTGRGTPWGGPVPTLKMASNSDLALKKKNWIDFNAGRMMQGENISDLADELLDFIIETASGRVKCRNEENGSRGMAIFKDGVTL